jgi:hypothetical protein
MQRHSIKWNTCIKAKKARKIEYIYIYVRRSIERIEQGQRLSAENEGVLIALDSFSKWDTIRHLLYGHLGSDLFVQVYALNNTPCKRI